MSGTSSEKSIETSSQSNGANALVPDRQPVVVVTEDGDEFEVNSDGCEVRSSDGDDDGEDLVGFIVGDDASDLEKSDEDAEDSGDESISSEEDIKAVADPSLIVEGKRQRRAPQRYMDPNYLKVVCADAKEAKVFLGSHFHEAKAKGLVPQKRARRAPAKRGTKRRREPTPEPEEEAADASDDAPEAPESSAAAQEAPADAAEDTDNATEATETATEESSTTDVETETDSEDESEPSEYAPSEDEESDDVSSEDSEDDDEDNEDASEDDGSASD